MLGFILILSPVVSMIPLIVHKTHLSRAYYALVLVIYRQTFQL